MKERFVAPVNMEIKLRKIVKVKCVMVIPRNFVPNTEREKHFTCNLCVQMLQLIVIHGQENIANCQMPLFLFNENLHNSSHNSSLLLLDFMRETIPCIRAIRFIYVRVGNLKIEFYKFSIHLAS